MTLNAAMQVANTSRRKEPPPKARLHQTQIGGNPEATKGDTGPPIPKSTGDETNRPAPDSGAPAGAPQWTNQSPGG